MPAALGTALALACVSPDRLIGTSGTGAAGGATPDGGAMEPGDTGDGGPACVHDPCGAGAPLDPNCNPCVAKVCQLAPGCCPPNPWGVDCAADEKPACGVACTSSADCPHSPCLVGGPLPGGASDACSLPVYRVCAQDDPICCTTAWTEGYAQAAQARGVVCMLP